MEIPLDLDQAMRVWNAIAQNPCAIQESFIHLQPQINEAQLKDSLLVRQVACLLRCLWRRLQVLAGEGHGVRNKRTTV